MTPPIEITTTPPNEEGVLVIRMMVVAPVEGGKTTLMAALAPELAVPERRVIVGPPVVEVLGARMGQQVVILRGDDKEACEEFFGGLLKSKKSWFIFLDEFDEFCPGGVTGSTGGYSCRSLYDIMNYGRNSPYRIGLFASSRGTADVTTNAIRACQVVFFGTMWEGNAIKYLRSCIKQGDIDFETIVRNLPPFVFMVWAPAKGGFKGFIEVHPDNTWSEWTPPRSEMATDEETTDSPPSDASPDSPPGPTPSSEPRSLLGGGESASGRNAAGTSRTPTSASVGGTASRRKPTG